MSLRRGISGARLAGCAIGARRRTCYGPLSRDSRRASSFRSRSSRRAAPAPRRRSGRQDRSRHAEREDLAARPEDAREVVRPSPNRRSPGRAVRALDARAVLADRDEARPGPGDAVSRSATPAEPSVQTRPSGLVKTEPPSPTATNAAPGPRDGRDRAPRLGQRPRPVNGVGAREDQPRLLAADGDVEGAVPGDLVEAVRGCTVAIRSHIVPSALARTWPSVPTATNRPPSHSTSKSQPGPSGVRTVQVAPSGDVSDAAALARRRRTPTRSRRRRGASRRRRNRRGSRLAVRSTRGSRRRRPRRRRSARRKPCPTASSRMPG